MNGLFSIQRKIPKISVGTEHFELVQFDRNIWDHGRAVDLVTTWALCQIYTWVFGLLIGKTEAFYQLYE